MPAPIVSYHPTILGDENLLLASQRPLDSGDEQAIARAAVVLLPQLCRPDLYQLVTRLDKPHFPRQEARLGFDGKVGNLRLFQKLGLPHPPAREFLGLEPAQAAWRAGELDHLGRPLVVKGAGGGEGDNVFLVPDADGVAALAGRLETHCSFGPCGLITQQFVAGGARDARAVLIGDYCDVFWRVAAPGEFKTNLAAGGEVLRGQDQPGLDQALALARELAHKAAFDVAAVDVLFPPDQGPLLCEINFYFGRQTMGGSAAFWPIYLTAVRGWLESLGLSPDRVQPDW